jgi:hypothetical protein
VLRWILSGLYQVGEGIGADEAVVQFEEFAAQLAVVVVIFADMPAGEVTVGGLGIDNINTCL